MKGKIFNGLVLVAFMFLSTGCHYWALDGNPGTKPDTNFIGTTDKKPLNIKTDNRTAIHIDTAGRVGIGTTNPHTRLEVTGGGRVMIEGGQRNIMSNTYLFPQSDPAIPGVTPHHFLMVLSSDSNGRGDLHFGKTEKIDATTNVDYSALIDGKTNEWRFFRKVTLGPIDSLPKLRDPTKRLSVEGNICATGSITGNVLNCNSSRVLKENIAGLSKQDAVSTLMDLAPQILKFT